MDKDSLQKTLDSLKPNQFIVCTGPKGIGKTHMINDFLSDKLGVISVVIEPGTKDSEIQRKVHCLFANALDFNLLHPASSSKRVLKWYKFIFRRSPIVVIAVKERSADKSDEYAKVPSAARELATMGFHVIVDASQNSYPNDLTGREEILTLSDVPVEVLVLYQVDRSAILN
jgi:AAA+ ATPase superfamily predicted ATPase